MLALLVSIPAAVAAPSVTADARGGAPDSTVALPDDPADADLGAAVGSLDARIGAERAEAAAAAKSLGEARARLEAANTALAAAERRVDALVSGAGVLAGFLDPRSQNGGLALPLTVDAATGERFMAARERVAAEAEKRSAAAVEARAQARRTRAARSAAEAAAARKAEFLEEAQQRLAEELDHASIAGDPQRQAEVKARRDELVAIVEAPKRAAARKAKAAAKAKADAEAAARARAEAAALTPRPLAPPTGAYPAVPCPGGDSITIDGSLAHNLEALLLAAWRDGVDLCGGGYRDRDQQVRLRIQHCGSSDYAIYQMPSGSCSPPTAVPGTSMHERGLAVDFRCAGHGMLGRSSPCFAWMAAHAAAFGLFNLSSEPWHWSVDGS
ncbi:MAG TPA: M15 family metallopeptidase [Acidimicrobiales bacterium]|nr:M15 family metallopeptidase [Acidimicrobiales bacterium]